MNYIAIFVKKKMVEFRGLFIAELNDSYFLVISLVIKVIALHIYLNVICLLDKPFEKRLCFWKCFRFVDPTERFPGERSLVCFFLFFFCFFCLTLYDNSKYYKMGICSSKTLIDLDFICVIYMLSLSGKTFLQ